MKGKILVFFQFFFIFLMLLPLGTRVENLEIGSGVILLGIFVGALALKENRFGNFNIVPDIKEECVLVVNGVYKYIRHPMYTSVLLSMLGVALLYATYYEYILFTLLSLNMLVKLWYEETLWESKSSEYIEYKKNTKRLIPFIF